MAIAVSPMDYELLNDGEPDEEGFIRAVIRNPETGKVTSNFKVKNERQLIHTLLGSLANASGEIVRLRKPDAARPPLRVQPKELTAADRLRLSAEITDPNRVVEAVDEIITARSGLTPDKIGAEFARMSEEEQNAFYIAEANAFKQEHPEYYPVPQNFQALTNELKASGWNFTRNNLAIVFQNLMERGELIPWPSDDQQNSPPQYEPNAPIAINGQAAPQSAGSPRPRTIATTGLRNSDASGVRPAPQPKQQRYTRADIERMSRAEYNDKLRGDPDFRRQVDAMSA